LHAHPPPAAYWVRRIDWTVVLARVLTLPNVGNRRASTLTPLPVAARDARLVSSLAAITLRQLGLPRATDLTGGFTAWSAYVAEVQADVIASERRVATH
jgi:hypothetical protein